MAKQICIVGAGASGITSIKSCLESGLTPICFEKTGDLGGVWKFRIDDREGVGSVMRSTTLITSKEFTAYSDFPPDPMSANYMHHTKFLNYMEEYINHFDLKKHISFNHEVVKVQRNEDYETTGRWMVLVRSPERPNNQKLIFDGVMLCTGCFVYPNIPFIPGMDTFRGQVMHSHSYKDHRGLEEKRIIVVGVGTSGTNIATELSKISQHVPIQLVARTGAWVIQRVEDSGLPFDYVYARRYLHLLYGRILPLTVTNEIFEAKLNQKFDHSLFRVRPPHRFVDKNATVEDDLAIRILSGTVAIRGGIERFTENGVIFKGEEEEYAVDVVILATGYELRIPCVEEEIVQVHNDRLELYHFVFPPHLNFPTLAVIGFIQPNGSILPVVEMQARWVAQIFKGNCSLPSQRDMHTQVDVHNRNRCGNPYETDWLSYLDTLASEIGAKPAFFTMALHDPMLGMKCFFGPSVPYQYRLQGPNTWADARTAIMAVQDRVMAPFDTKQEFTCRRNVFPVFRIAVIGLLIIFLISYFFF